MVKKKINIILIVVVLGLWGSVFYKTINRFFTSKELAVNNSSGSTTVKFNQINKDTFALENVSRDPFLNKQVQEVVSRPQRQYVANTSHSAAVKKAAPAPTMKHLIVWPSISYHGYIKDSRGEMVILKIDSKMFRLRKNDLVDGLMIKKISSDSLEVDFNKEKKIIKRFKI
ncbi:hypothetical protein D0817_14835 [Flavobacterium cupreum]|uniref:Type II secretion system protein GspC N-terminal domain-containing protein n=1 Tax=Flavobacterium cupreum TaxID=2133766 RepID=A0A434A6C9_9FLAO|nr:hypothetical protein [Flavobacterium cupreum]RUT69887.1 hypothetical protein D0817_14835 [Flavobacterium cupreum]